MRWLFEGHGAGHRDEQVALVRRAVLERALHDGVVAVRDGGELDGGLAALFAGE